MPCFLTRSLVKKYTLDINPGSPSLPFIDISSLAFLYLKHDWVWIKFLAHRSTSYLFLAPKLPRVGMKPNRKALSISFENAWSGENACFLFVWLHGLTPRFIKLDFIYSVIHPECSLSWLPMTDIIKYTKSFYQMIKEATVSKNFIYLTCCINSLNPYTFYNFSSLKVKACQLNFTNSGKKWGSSPNSSLCTSDQTSPHYTSILLPVKVTIAEHNHTKSKLQTLYIMEVVNSLEVYFLVPEQQSEPIYKFLRTVAWTKHICSV